MNEVRGRAGDPCVGDGVLVVIASLRSNAVASFHASSSSLSFHFPPQRAHHPADGWKNKQQNKKMNGRKRSSFRGKAGQVRRVSGQEKLDEKDTRWKSIQLVDELKSRTQIIHMHAHAAVWLNCAQNDRYESH